MGCISGMEMEYRNKDSLWKVALALGLGEPGDLIGRWDFHGGVYVLEWHKCSVHSQYPVCIQEGVSSQVCLGIGLL